MNRILIVAVVLVALLSVLPALAYEYPLSSSAIRDAYFAGTGTKGTDASLYDAYSRTIPNPAKEPPVSTVTIDTPYLQVAEHSRERPNYHVQDAVDEYFGKPAKFLVFVDVYFQRPQRQDPRDNGELRSATGSLQGVAIELKQNRKTIDTKIVDSGELYPFRDAQTSAEWLGEHVELACDAASIDSSELKIEVRTPGNQEHEVKFDLAQIK
jgi:hypothetical protein